MTLLHCGIIGAAAVLVLTLLRAVFRRHTPAWIWPCLWVLAGLRFLIPFGLPLAVPAGTELPEPLVRTEAALQTFLTAETEIETVSETTSPAGIAETEEEREMTAAEEADFAAWLQESSLLLQEMEEQRERTETMIFRRTLLARIWLAGSVLCGGYCILLYLLLMRQFREGKDCDAPAALPVLRRKIRFRITDMTDTPMTCGILRPLILLPSGVADEEPETQRTMVYHEFCHVRRMDTLTKAFLLLTAVVHWWNPMVWLMLRMANRDMELACDEAAVRMLAGDSRRYAEVLLQAAEKQAKKRKSHRLALPFGESPLTERITAVLDGRKKHTWLAAVLLCVISAALVCCGPMDVTEDVQSAKTDGNRAEESLADAYTALQAEEESVPAEYRAAEAEEDALHGELEKYLAETEQESEPAETASPEVMLTDLEHSVELLRGSIADQQAYLESLMTQQEDVRNLYEAVAAMQEEALAEFDTYYEFIAYALEEGQNMEEYHEKQSALWDHMMELQKRAAIHKDVLDSYESFIQLAREKIAFAESEIIRLEQKIHALRTEQIP